MTLRKTPIGFSPGVRGWTAVVGFLAKLLDLFPGDGGGPPKWDQQMPTASFSPGVRGWTVGQLIESEACALFPRRAGVDREPL